MKKQLHSLIFACTLLFAASGLAQPAWQPEICLVTVDSATATYISVVWNKPVATDIDSFYVYRADSNTTVFSRIAEVAYTDSSVYDDIAVNVNTTWYTYKISAVDQSGAEGPHSPEAVSNCLDVIPNVGSWYMCKWNQYTNPSNPANFVRCMWDSLGGTTMTQVGSNFSPSWTSWNHTGYSQANSSTYRMEAELVGSCTPSRVALINTSRSNIKNIANPTMFINTFEQLNALVRAYPNPCNDLLQIEWNAAIGVSKIDVCDVAGRIVKSFVPADSELKRTLELTEIASGVYFVNFHSVKGLVSRRIVVE